MEDCFFIFNDGYVWNMEFLKFKKRVRFGMKVEGVFEEGIVFSI